MWRKPRARTDSSWVECFFQVRNEVDFMSVVIALSSQVGALEIEMALPNPIILFNPPSYHSPASHFPVSSRSPCSWALNVHWVNSGMPVVVACGGC